MSRLKPRLKELNRRQEGGKPEKQTAKTGAASSQTKAAMPGALADVSSRGKLGVALACLLVGIVAYWPTLTQLVNTWNKEPDYSHGYLVVPLAALFMWVRRGSYPGLAASSPVLAIGLLATSLALRFVGARYFFTFMDGWSIVPWAAALVAAVGGWPLLKWSLPSVGFLIFMVPLPFRLEGQLSAPLQQIATKLSTTTLQMLGHPAFSEGNVILIGDEKLEVAQACSGLRLFVSVLALTYAYITVISRPWWEKLMLALAAVPIAIIANMARIVATGLLYECTKSEWARKLAHDSAGWGMILFAAAAFGLLLWYLKHLIVEEETVEIDSIVRRTAV